MGYHYNKRKRWAHECRPGFVYVLRAGEVYKVGFTSDKYGLAAVHNRVRDLRQRHGLESTFLFALGGKCGLCLERYVHDQLFPKRKRGQGCQELFYLTDRDLDWLRYRVTPPDGDSVVRYDELPSWPNTYKRRRK